MTLEERKEGFEKIIEFETKYLYVDHGNVPTLNRGRIVQKNGMVFQDGIEARNFLEHKVLLLLLFLNNCFMSKACVFELGPIKCTR